MTRQEARKAAKALGGPSAFAFRISHAQKDMRHLVAVEAMDFIVFGEDYEECLEALKAEVAKRQ